VEMTLGKTRPNRVMHNNTIYCPIQSLELVRFLKISYAHQSYNYMIKITAKVVTL